MITKRDIAISKLLKEPKLIEVVCTVTTAKGDTSSNKAVLVKNRLNKLQGNGLSAKHLYDLQKLGRCEVTDIFGTRMVYETKPYVKKNKAKEVVSEQQEAPPNATETSEVTDA